jgi:DNA invertase Pin-like site-specific DNA recombinase
VLVVSEESRIGRESIETSWIIKQILGTGVRLFFYLEDVERRLDTAMDKILLSLKNFGAEVEREKVRQRTQDGLLVRFRAGAATGDRCYGYLDVRRDNGFSYRQIDEGQAAVVRRIFSLYADGMGGNRIAQMLDRESVLTPRRDARRGWNPATVMDILRNPHYIGRVAFRRRARVTRVGTYVVQFRPDAERLERGRAIPSPVASRGGCWVGRPGLTCSRHICSPESRRAACATGHSWRSRAGKAKRRDTDACTTTGRARSGA